MTFKKGSYKTKRGKKRGKGTKRAGNTVSNRAHIQLSNPMPLKQIGFLPFPPSFDVRLPYSKTLVGLAAPGASIAGVYNFRTNSLFDPDEIAGTGFHPRQFNELKSIYKSYIVHGAKVTFEYSDPSADGMYVGMNVMNNTPSGAAASNAGSQTLDYLKEMRNCDMRPINNSGSQRTTFTMYIPNHTVANVPKSVYNADRVQYGALTTGNPNEQLRVQAVVLEPNAGTPTINCVVTIVYHATMYDYVTPARSS